MPLLEKAQATGNRQAVDELRRIGPPPYANGEGYGIQRKWSNRFEGADRFLYGTLGLALVAPGYSVRDLNDSLDGQNLSGDRLAPQMRSETMKELGLEFRVPMFFFQGTEDFTSPTALARQYLGAIKAPLKEFVPIDGGHFAVFTHSDQFREELEPPSRGFVANPQTTRFRIELCPDCRRSGSIARSHESEGHR